MVRIINKLLEENKRAWNTKLKYSLWEDKISTKRDIGMSPFQLVYGAGIIFLVSLGLRVMKLFQEQDEELNHMQRRINQLIELHQMIERQYDRVHVHQEKMKKTFDRKIKEGDFQINDLVLIWNARKEDKHGNFDYLWKGPYVFV